MTSLATGLGVCCAVSLNMASVFVHQTPPPPNPKPPVQASAKSTVAEITVTGCLVQGSAANVFILQNAKQDPQSTTEKAARYVVVPAAEDLVLKPHVNHQVRLLGVPDGRPQPAVQAGAPVDEKAIPALNAKSLTMVSASCGTAELLGNAPPPNFTSSRVVVDPRIVNPNPGTLALIATGLLLVVYAGRQREWRAFGRGSLR